MVYIFIEDIIFLAIISIILIILYKRIVQNWNIIEKISHRYQFLYRKNKLSERIKIIKRKPIDRQEIIFKDTLIFFVALLIIVLFATKAIFLAAVVSESMTPTFNRDDLILLQNIDRRYEVGDMVIFKTLDTSLPITHRIVSVDEDGIRTAGDATRTMDWWLLKEKDIFGKVLTMYGRPIVIKGYGKFFIIEDKNQRFGPFDYRAYTLFLNVIRIYGYAIAIISILIYIALSLKTLKKNNENLKWKMLSERMEIRWDEKRNEKR